MPKQTLAVGGMPLQVSSELAGIGESIRLARKRRDLTQAELAGMMFVSPRTVVRLEKGEPGISLAVFLTALFCLNLNHEVSSLFAADKDAVGINMDIRKHGQRKQVHKSKNNTLDF